jgi:AcrR family transcriptional regulator
MNSQLLKNKQGQSLGKKGYATRERLLHAAQRLIKKHSPLDLTAVAIAKEAQSSSATFYMYFDDVREVLFSLSQEAGNDVVTALEGLESSLTKVDVNVAAMQLVNVFNEVWDRHRHILMYRNLEADRGDAKFEKLRLEEYIREVEVLGRWIRASGGQEKPTKSDAFSLATVLHAAMERLASTDPQAVVNGIGKERLVAAQTRVISQVIADTGAWGKLPLKGKTKIRRN